MQDSQQNCQNNQESQNFEDLRTDQSSQISNSIQSAPDHKETKKEKHYILFAVRNVPFTVERKHVPDSGPLNIMLNDNSNSDKLFESKEDEQKVDIEILRTLLYNIHNNNIKSLNTKYIITYKAYISLLWMINYFNFTYDHDAHFELHSIYKYNFVCKSDTYDDDPNKKFCIFTISGDKVSLFISYTFMN